MSTTTTGTGAFNKFLSEGDLSGGTGGVSVTSPDLTPEAVLTIDGTAFDYPVTQWSFRPNQDVKSEDTGHGVVRIAWDELENSGNLTLTIADVPPDEIDPFIETLLEVRPYRWLGFRGRRYRTNGFTVDYKPERDKRYYTVNVKCTAYRPHKSLPPVPGTEMFPLVDIRRHGANSVDDEIISITGLESWLAIVHSRGISAWDTDTGTAFQTEESIDAGAQVGFFGGMGYIAYGNNGSTYVREFSPSRGFSSTRKVLGVPYSKHTHFLNGDTLYYIENDVLKMSTFAQNIVQTVRTLPAGTRVNPIGAPRFLSPASNTNVAHDIVGNCASDVLGVCETNGSRALVFRTTGVHVYNISRTATSMYLTTPVLNADGSPVIMDTTTDMQAFGIFGSPGVPEGYWYRDADETVMEEFMPDGASVAPTLAYQDSAAEWATSQLITGMELQSDDSLMLIGFGSEPSSVYLVPEATLDPQTFSNINSSEPAITYTGEGFGVAQSTVVDITNAGIVQESGFSYEAVIGEVASITPFVRLNAGSWVEVTATPREEQGLNGTVFIYDNIPVISQGQDVTGDTLQFKFEVSSPDVAVDNPKLYYVAFNLASETSSSTFVDSDLDGTLEAPIIYQTARIRSVYADSPVDWNNMRGVYYNGYRYYPYTNQHVFQVFPLL